MKRYGWKLLAALVALLAATIVLCAGALADERFTITSDGVITRYTGTDIELVIPAEIDGIKVSSIGTAAFASCNSLTSVTIPESVTSIGEYVFDNCDNLISVTIPGSVTSISNSTFNDCDNLKNVTIQEGVASIGYRAFAGCDNLANVEIPASVTNIGEYAFFSCNRLLSVTIPEGVTNIGKAAFKYCTLSSVTIPDSVTNIGSEAFLYCRALTRVEIPDSVTAIGKDAFSVYTSIVSSEAAYAKIWAEENGRTWLSDTSCAHSNAVVIDEDGGSWFSEDVRQLDDDYHEIPNYVQDVIMLCHDCGVTFESRVVITLKEEHSLVYWSQGEIHRGTCTTCGYVCTHTDVETRQYIKSGTESYQPLDDESHTVTGELWEEKKCKKCHTIVSDEKISDSYSEIEEHDWDEEACFDCGHANPCTHANITRKEYYEHNYAGEADNDGIEIRSFNDLYHSYTTSLYADIRCRDCGWRQNGVLVSEAVTRYGSHRFNGDEPDVCIWCEYENSCEHDKTVTNQYIEWNTETYQQIDEKTHLVSGILVEEVSCQRCGTKISEKSDSGSIVEQHSCTDGQCVYCEYIVNCEHPNQYMEWRSSTEWPFKIYTPVDGQHHQVNGEGRPCFYCADCDEYLGEGEWSQGMLYEEEHTYVDGVCMTCGYSNICEHTNQTTEQYLWYASEAERQNAVCTEIDDTWHRMYGPLFEKTFCKDCGEVFSDKKIEENGSLEYEHDYVDGVCEGCGYAKTETVLNGWNQIDCKWYFYENGEKVMSSWRKDSTGWVYLGEDGAMLTDAWVMDSVGWCYVGSDGYAVTNTWKQDSVGWCYLNSEGSMTKNAWVKTNGETYRLNGDGYRVENAWVQVDGKWYWMNGDGAMAVNAWMKDSVGWVWLGSDGAMATNAWVADSKGWCYVGTDGYAVTNCWKQDSVGWCYLDDEGSMVKNAWVTTDGKTYRLNGDGYRMENTWVEVGGKWYWLESDGAMAKNQWKQDSVGWVYVGSDGAMVTNAWTKDSVGWCYMGSDGYAVTNEWRHDGTGWRYLDGNGSMMKNAWLQDGGSWYWFDNDGYMVTGTVVIGGVEHKFDNNGVWLG